MWLQFISLSSVGIAMANALAIQPSVTAPRNLATMIARQTAVIITPTPSIGPDGYYTSTDHITIQGVTNDHVTVAGQTIDIPIATCVQTITPDANGYVPPGTCGAIWDYYPSFSAAAVFAVLFGILTLVHLWQAVSSGKRFCWVIIMASIWETSALVFRAISAKKQQSDGIYLIFQIFILLAPLWINAFAYMLLARTIHAYHPRRGVLSIPAPILAAGFVSLDIIAFAVQLAGGSMAGPRDPPDKQLRAIHVYMGGIGLQEAFIVVFAGMAARFHVEMLREERTRHHRMNDEKRNQTVGEAPPHYGWRRLLGALYAALALVTVRIIFRLIEFSRGQSVGNPLITTEAYFYVLEAAPMFLAILAFNISHPGFVLIGPASEMPAFWTTLRMLCCGRVRRNVIEPFRYGDAVGLSSRESVLSR